jgi:hypothetical protein
MREKRPLSKKIKRNLAASKRRNQNWYDFLRKAEIDGK